MEKSEDSSSVMDSNYTRFITTFSVITSPSLSDESSVGLRPPFSSRNILLRRRMAHVESITEQVICLTYLKKYPLLGLLKTSMPIGRFYALGRVSIKTNIFKRSSHWCASTHMSSN